MHRAIIACIAFILISSAASAESFRTYGGGNYGGFRWGSGYGYGYGYGARYGASYGYSGGYGFRTTYVVPVYYRVPIYIIPARSECGCNSKTIRREVVESPADIPSRSEPGKVIESPELPELPKTNEQTPQDDPPKDDPPQI